MMEEFIEEFRDKVKWKCIIEHQMLSKSFIKKFQKYIDLPEPSIK